MSFTAGPIPQNTEPKLVALIRLIWSKFQSLETELNHTIFPTHSAEPKKPGVGLTVYADGTNWNPGAGSGLYRWSGTAWVKM